MEVLYKVLIVFCLLFIASGVVYYLYFLPKVPNVPVPSGAFGSLLMQLLP
ncbi:hypothetical protein ACTID9_08465 [Brevibacillus fluminis]